MKTGELEGFKKSDIIIGITLVTDVTSEKIFRLLTFPFRILRSFLPLLTILLKMLWDAIVFLVVFLWISSIAAFILLLINEALFWEFFGPLFDLVRGWLK